MARVAFGALLCLVQTSLASAKCPITNSTTVVIYTGVGVPEDCNQWETKFFQWWQKSEPAVEFVYVSGPELHSLASSCTLSDWPNLKVYVQPGGDAYSQQNSIGDTGKANILKYIDSKHGIYLGTCAGWFFASDGYYWEGVKYNWPNLLGKFPTTEGSIHEIATYPDYAMTDTSSGEKMIYFGGPTRGYNNTPDTSPGNVLMTFTDPKLKAKNMPAAVQNGNMLLFAVHAEAYEGIKITGLSTEQRLRNYQYRAQAINKAAGLDWAIPSKP